MQNAVTYNYMIQQHISITSASDLSPQTALFATADGARGAVAGLHELGCCRAHCGRDSCILAGVCARAHSISNSSTVWLSVSSVMSKAPPVSPRTSTCVSRTQSLSNERATSTSAAVSIEHCAALLPPWWCRCGGF